ncbi:MAG: UDP-N-acetylmuramoyl-L-alanyl-D-glutamate--2,6-diaminopimelate ligase [Rhizobiaceae bacterium]|nr:UDP-N-acetylmuramoyl-L-alanyl-D-glutamate--2,6-diaminopimelate ligase [Rhizobiaceae bacterium]MCV0406559.1 UDP-N-acetylmuramoyl-L-alanyl-D-glutamate--2,6-diaminopimelate ligase [Rhizobiaceae bacterium]
MRLIELSGILPLDGLPAAGTVEISGLSSDSRTVEPGHLFAALKGAKSDGMAFARDAVSRGAAAILAGREGAAEGLSVPVIRVDDPRRALALAAARFFGGQPEVMVAVTGTSGKTSVASFTRQIWSHAGFGAASIGTTGVSAPGREDYGSLTTPDPVALHRLLKELADSGVTHAAMEASSHGLDQRRLDGVRLSAGGFTNLGRDHMDYHATIEDYLAAKMRLFDTLLPKGAPAVIFADDAWSQAAGEAAAKAGLEVMTVGRKGSLLALKRVEHERHRQRAEIQAGGVIHEVDLPLAGDFQIANALVAAGLAIATGLETGKALDALEHLKGAAGRLDLVGTTAEGAPVYVDYAHKPEALENVLSSVRPFTTGRVVVVFGCGGDRDRGKRPIMGEIATRLADVVVVTDDNPRSERPAAIRAEILAAAPGALEIGDRRQAIRQAVAMLKAGDTLVIAGKGHEIGQTIGDVTHHFSDHEESLAALSSTRTGEVA